MIQSESEKQPLQKLYDLVTDLTTEISKLDKSVRENTYAINCMIFSSLATTEQERDKVRSLVSY